ncbi:mannan endo-1,4-beta-mannosidase 1 [Stachybotrys elegans]|uniref:Mannan endo-1,4-beta-mannosidase A n=1 Tax=Stachybotrys elegans TaxID=80388 RepID=A0A8K0WL04_9HYPO|nr:mannan endo-1,4-beta-mannosidase 1 [Stachybotrys elegans]
MTFIACGLPTIATCAAIAQASRGIDNEQPHLEGRAVPPGFATTNGTHFTIDGRSEYLVGTNAYWLPFLTNNADVDLTMDQLQASGIKVLRTWGFNDVTSIPTDPSTVWFQYLSSSGSIINTGANGLQRLDYVVAAAEKRGLKLIIPFVNHWQDYGGIPAYTSAFGTGGSTWYKHQPAQAQYRLYVKELVSRYAASPAIFAWQLANEPRCMLCSTDDIFNWATTTSEYIKSLDPYHMVTIGDEGQGLTGDVWPPYWLIFGTDFARNLQIKTIDFGTFHMYPTTWGVPLSFAYNWIRSHASKCVAFGKPCYLEEYGVPSSRGHCEVESEWQTWALQTEGIAGDGFWQVGTTLSTGPTHDDTFTIYHDSPEWTCLVTDHVENVRNISAT